MSDTVEIKKSHIAVVVAVVITVIVLAIGIGIGVLVSRDNDSESEGTDAAVTDNTNGYNDILFGEMAIPAACAAEVTDKTDYSVSATVYNDDGTSYDIYVYYTEITKASQTWYESEMVDDLMDMLTLDGYSDVEENDVSVEKVEEINGFYIFKLTTPDTYYYAACRAYGGTKYQITTFDTDKLPYFENLLEQIELK